MNTAPVTYLSTPAQIAASMPHLIGYLPTDSVVIVALNDRAVIVAGRMDAPPVECADDMPAWVIEGFVNPVRSKQPITGVLIVGYDEPGVAAVQAVVDSGVIEDAGLCIVDALGVVGPMWRGLTCDRSQCEGCGGIIDYGDPITAEWIVQGSAATTVSRSDIEASLTPAPIDLPVGFPAQARDGWANILAGQWTPEDLAAVSADPDPALRDAFLLAYVGAWVKGLMGDSIDDLDAATVEWARALPPLGKDSMVENLRRAAVAANTAVLWTVFANTAWRVGDGTLANIAIERALAVDPEYRLARLISMMLDTAVKLDGDPVWVQS
jgi:Domain of unknown function (DUF4192)